MYEDIRTRLYSSFRETASCFPIITPLILLGLITIFFRSTDFDLSLVSSFYSAETKQWPLADKNPWEFIDQWFVFPGMILGIASLLLSAYGLIARKKTRLIQSANLLAIVLLLGPGLLVNGTLKPAFSRPRPREVVQLGGDQEYEAVLGFGEQLDFNASFPSGHASIGFYLIAPAFLIRRDWKKQFALFGAGFVYGSIMSLSRIVQGGHYLSDVIWSLGLIYIVCWLTRAWITASNLKHNTKSESGMKTEVSFKPSEKSVPQKFVA